MKKEEKNAKRIVIIEKGVDMDTDKVDINSEECCWGGVMPI